MKKYRSIILLGLCLVLPALSFANPGEEDLKPSMKKVVQEVREKVKKKFPHTIKEVKADAVAEADKKKLTGKDRKLFIDKQVRQYYRAKSDYVNEVFAEIREKIDGEGHNKVFPYDRIDFDQGFQKGKKKILWGMKQDKVNSILKGDISEGLDTPVETVKFEEGQIKEAQLFFINKLFYQVKITYNIKTKEEGGAFWKQITEKYGEPEPYKPTPKTEKSLPSYTYTWKGRFHTGMLQLEMNPSQTTYTKVIFTKTSVNLLDTQKALKEAKEKRKQVNNE